MKSCAELRKLGDLCAVQLLLNTRIDLSALIVTSSHKERTQVASNTYKTHVRARPIAAQCIANVSVVAIAVGVVVVVAAAINASTSTATAGLIIPIICESSPVREVERLDM